MVKLLTSTLLACTFAVAVVGSSARQKRNAIATEIMAAQDKDKEYFTKEFLLPPITKLIPIKLGEGKQGAVYRVTLASSGQEFALKVAPTGVSPSGIGHLGVREKEAMLDLSPKIPAVPRVFENFSKTSDSGKYTTLAMTLAGPSVELGNHAGKYFTHSGVKRLFHLLVVDIATMHKEGWCHNDLRAPNIAISAVAGEQDKYFLIDFGKASKIAEDKKCVESEIDTFYSTMYLLNKKWTENPPIDPETLKLFKAAKDAMDWTTLDKHIADWFATVPSTASHLLTTWSPTDKPSRMLGAVNFRPVTPYAP